jgi:drug/metabolite transporter (DMT)-like permease
MVSSSGKKQGFKLTSALLAVQIFYGVHYLAAKWIVAEMRPGAWAVLRTSTALVIIAILALILKSRWPSRGDIARLALCAFFGIVLNQALFLEGIARTSASHSALINSQIPSFALLWALLLRHEKLSFRKILSFLAGIAGVLVLLEIENFRFSGEYMVGDLLTIGNAASFGLFLVISRDVIQRNDPVAATSVLFFFGAIGLTIYGSQDLTSIDFEVLSGRVIAAMVFAILAATVGTYFLNLWALKQVRSSRVALYVFLQPLIASVVGVLVLGETIGVRFAIAASLVFTALLLRDEGA